MEFGWRKPWGGRIESGRRDGLRALLWEASLLSERRSRDSESGLLGVRLQEWVNLMNYENQGVLTGLFLTPKTRV